MDFWRFRTLSIGSPFRNINAGRKTEADGENNRRYKIGAENYLDEYRGNLLMIKIFSTNLSEFKYNTRKSRSYHLIMILC